MRVLVLGSGGREHALCHCISRSPQLTKLFCLPGNAGTARIATNVPGNPTDIARVLMVARREQIDLTIVGPEDPLAAGIVDAFTEAKLPIFGPHRTAARLESDKSFAKQFMRQFAIPTADAQVFSDFRHARDFIASRDEALVVKAAGLAKGKGAVVCEDPAQALLVAENMMVARSLGEAGDTIVVEERLIGREVSLIVILDGRTMCVLDPAQDYKRLRDNDEGPNTGGMGSFCPSDLIDPMMMRQIEGQILVPMMDALVREQLEYRGVLYVGLMLTAGGPKVLEFNCRFGDPETQVLMMRLETDAIELFHAAAHGRLEGADVNWRREAAACVVLASAGYPDAVVTGKTITGLPERDDDDLTVFHAGTKRIGDEILTTGGRVLGVTALGDTVADAADRAYSLAERIHFDGKQFRRDIGRLVAPIAISSE